MSTTIPKEELRALIASLADMPACNVLWDGESVPFVGPNVDDDRVQGILTLNPTARRAVGVDEEKREYPTPTTLKRTFTGQRVVTISVTAENYDVEEGFDLLEQIRTLLGADENRAALNIMGLSLAQVTDVRTLDVAVDNRELSAAQMDLIVNQRVERVITKTGDTFIQTVEIEGESDLVIAGDDVIAAP